MPARRQQPGQRRQRQDTSGCRDTGQALLVEVECAVGEIVWHPEMAVRVPFYGMVVAYVVQAPPYAGTTVHHHDGAPDKVGYEQQGAVLERIRGHNPAQPVRIRVPGVHGRPPAEIEQFDGPRLPVPVVPRKEQIAVVAKVAAVGKHEARRSVEPLLRRENRRRRDGWGWGSPEHVHETLRQRGDVQGCGSRDPESPPALGAVLHDAAEQNGPGHGRRDHEQRDPIRSVSEEPLLHKA